MIRSFASALMLVVLVTQPAAATESTEAPVGTETVAITETFDALPVAGWDISPQATVTEGVLVLRPGGAAFYPADSNELAATWRIRYSGPGEVLFTYASSEGDSYSLVVIGGGGLVLVRSEGGTPVDMAADQSSRIAADTWADLTISVTAGSHQVDVDGETVLTASDPSPLGAGGIGVQALGDITVSVDQVQLTGVAAVGAGGGEAPSVTAPPGAAPEPAPGPVIDPDAIDATPIGPQSQAPDTTAAPTGEGGLRGLVEDVFRIESPNVEVGEFVVNLVLAAILSYILSRVYVHWGSALSNRRRFASNFMLVTVTTTFIILVVRSSVALSLGLVGALSIVRFRAAIKDPEELAYMFLAIGIGIGLGDNQRLITILAMTAAVALIGLLHLFRSRGEADANLHLTIASSNPGRVELPEVRAALEPHCTRVRLTRYDETATETEAAFLVEFRQPGDLDAARTALRRLSPGLTLTFLDDQGLW